MTRDTYIIDGDQHLLGGTAQTGRELVEMYWRLDEEGALLFPDEYEDLRRELAHYAGKAETELDDYSRWHFAKLRAFFAAHPEPPTGQEGKPK